MRKGVIRMSDLRDEKNGGEDGFSWLDESERFKKSLNDPVGNIGQPGQRTGQRRNAPVHDPIFSDNRPRNRVNSGNYEYHLPDGSPPLYTDYLSRPVSRDGSPSVSAQSRPRRNEPSVGENRRQAPSGQGQKKPSGSGKKKPGKSSTGKSAKGKASGKKPSAGRKSAPDSRKAQGAGRPAADRPGTKPSSGSGKPKKGAAAGNKKPRSGKLTRKILSSYFKRLIRRGYSEDDARKKLAKLKKAIGRLKIASIVFAVLLFAVAIALILCVTKGAPIEKIVIDGEKLYSESQILSASGISVGDNMLMIRQKKTNETITTTLPYVSSVKVDYQLPDTLRLVIKETTDKYYVVLDGTYVCIDENDKVVSNVKRTVKGKRYRVEGLAAQEYKIGRKFEPQEKNGNAQKYETAKKIAAAIEKAGLKNCTVINVSDLDRIYVVYDSKLWMYFEADSDFEYKMKFVAQALSDSRTANMISASERSYIDLRLDNQAVFKTGRLS